MKIINKSDIHEMKEFFNRIKSDNEQIVVWQYNPELKKRLIYNASITDFDDTSITFLNEDYSNDSNETYFKFISDSIYFYVEKQQTIFKCTLVSFQSNSINLSLPDEIKLMDKNDEKDDQALKVVRKTIGNKFLKNTDKHLRYEAKTERIQTKMVVKFKNQSDQKLFEKELTFISPDVEDKIFSIKREAPRARAQKGKLIIIARNSQPDEIQRYGLFDLSRGGFSFVVKEETKFTKGDLLNVIGFDHEEFSHPIFAKVMGVHPIDQLGSEHKVGCKFMDTDEMAQLL